FELIPTPRFGTCQTRFHLATSDDLQRVRVQQIGELAFLLSRVGRDQEMVVQADFRVERLVRRDPVDGALDLARGARSSAPGLRIIGTMYLDHLTAALVLHDAHTSNDVGIAKTHLPTWSQPKKLFRRIFPKIFPLDVEYAGERDLP